jgi:hypothetical protein
MDDNVGIIDDSNPNIQYVPAELWISAGEPEEYNTTTHGTSSEKSQVKIAFNGTPMLPRL